MRKLLITLFCLVLVFALAASAWADTTAPTVSVYATVSGNGSCQVSIHVTLKLDQAQKNLAFPVPANARNVRLNGTRVSTRTQGDIKNIDLSRTLGGSAGEFNFTVSYTLKKVVSYQETGVPLITVPLLSGFAYPIEMLEFSVTIPGPVTAKPAFTSGYHQATIEQSLSAEASGNSVTGYSLKNLKDQETLVMTLEVDPQMFPAPGTPLEASVLDDIGILVCVALGLLYWLFKLRCKPLRPQKTDLPPAGFGPGEMGSLLTFHGADLTMMVFGWAQLGYILIQPERSKRVFLHKRMDMGNERSAFEQRCFNNLFAGKKLVDTSGYRYAMLCRKMHVLSPMVRPLISSRSGNPKLFALLCAGAGLFGGMSMGFALGGSVVLQWFLAVLLAPLGAYSAWTIQKWADCLVLHDKQKLRTALYHCAGWVLLGLIAGIPLTGFAMAAFQLLAGLMAAYGIRRTEEGLQTARQVLGLRKYLKRMDKNELARILQADPDYFHALAPYALAMGVLKPFARSFGKSGISACPYLSTGMDGHRSAMEWATLMEDTAQAMDLRRKQMSRENFQKLLAILRK